MSINSVTAMDVDSPTGGANSLKRSSSAPMINDINNTTMTTSPSTNSSMRDSNNYNIFSSIQPRTRRFSASFSPVPGSPGLRMTPRISQIRQEECAEREVAHERDVHSQMQMSQSCEDLTLMNESLSLKNDSELKSAKDCKMMPLHLNLGPCHSPCSSPSPTRPGYFSPGITGVHNMWKTTSPSPSRKHTYCPRRSLSPIAIRQSTLGSVSSVKRKLDDEKIDSYSSPRAKRFNNNPNERAGLLMAHNNTSSPLPGSLSSVGTPESLSSADSPGSGFTFRPVDSPSPNRPLQNTGDEPMNEERSGSETPTKIDQIMTSVDQSPS